MKEEKIEVLIKMCSFGILTQVVVGKSWVALFSILTIMYAIRYLYLSFKIK